MLTLYEELYLLALDEDKGNLIWFVRKSFVYPIAGIILAELALLGKLSVGDKLRLVALESGPSDDPILNETLEEIRASDKPRKPAYWVSRLSEEPKKLRQRIGERLAEKNILIQDEKRFFRKEVAAGSEPGVPDKFQIKYDLRAPVLMGGELDQRKLTFLEMLAAGDLLSLIFTEDELETAELTIHKKLLEAALGNPNMQLIEEIGQAVASVREDEIE